MTDAEISNAARLGRRASRSILALLSTAALVGCAAVGPNFVAPAPPAQQAYTAQPVAGVASAGDGQPTQRLTPGTPLQADWWTKFGSSELNQTVALAAANNRTLEAAQANLSSAAEQIRVARGGLYPQVDASASIGPTKYGAGFLGPLAATFPRFTAYSAGATISYDPDVFGGVHRSIEQASASAAVVREALNAARLEVTGDTVVEALQIASIRAQIDVIKEVLVSDERTLDLVKTAHASGMASDIDVTSAQSQLDHDRTLLPPLVQGLNAAQDALPILVGKTPADWSAPDFALDGFVLPGDLPLAVPSMLVRQRPDIRAAEARLHAASAAVGVATADLYPRFTLNALVAEQGLLNGPAGVAWSVIGGLSAPIFHGGSLTARKRAAQDDYRAAYAQYQQTVLESFRQVADTLHDLSNSADEVRTQEEALASADAALRLTRLGYGAGNAGIVQILDAQRLRQLAELGLVQARTERYLATVDLFLAMGGGGDPAPSGAKASLVEVRSVPLGR
jgi:NodT family efflux transporter outer membrane factor (OMF) lipoprotein